MQKKVFIFSIIVALDLFLVGRVFYVSHRPVGGISLAQEETAPAETVFFDVQKEEKRSVSLLFLGDAMLDRQIRTVIEKKGASFLTEKMLSLIHI